MSRSSLGGRKIHDMDERARILLKEIVQRHIADGAPIGARALSRDSDLRLSTASISNFMADLEEEGLIASPRASAGRVPTPKGYRYYVDSVLSQRLRFPSELLVDARDRVGELLPDRSLKVAEKAAELLSVSSNFVGVVSMPPQPGTFHHIEFLSLGERRILVILVSPKGDVQNKVIVTPRPYTQGELTSASNILNRQYSGLSVAEASNQLRSELDAVSDEIRGLMKAALAVGVDASRDAPVDLIISGKRNLLDAGDFESDLQSLRRLFDLFEQKAELMRLMETSSSADGVGVFIGGTAPDSRYHDFSIVSAPYMVDGVAVGILGVIGPTRMPYDRLIGLVGRASQIVGHAMSQSQNC